MLNRWTQNLGTITVETYRVAQKLEPLGLIADIFQTSRLIYTTFGTLQQRFVPNTFVNFIVITCTK